MKKKILATVLLVCIFTTAILPVTAFAQEPEALEFRMIYLTDGARDIALEDFDYLIDMILQTAPTQGVFYRRFGLSMEDFFAAWRQVIYDKTPLPAVAAMNIGLRWADVPEDDRYMAAEYLLILLNLMAAEAENIGHFGPQISLALWLLLYPITLEFMEMEHTYLTPEMFELWVQDYGQEAAERYQRMLSGVINVAHLHYELFNRPATVWFYGFTPADVAAGTNLDFDPEIFTEIAFMFNNPNNVTTGIIEQDRVAYIRIESFGNDLELDRAVLFPFYEQIQDYEHLIIDLRGNGGGDPRGFIDNVLAMLIDESVSYQRAEFFIESELTADHFAAPMGFSEFMSWSDIVPITEFMQGQDLPNFNPNDLSLLDSVITWESHYHPIENNIPFSGEIWLLVDGNSASAAELAAITSIKSGFATVVGEPTARVTGVQYTFASLPNTGILFRIDIGYTINPDGSSMEEFGVLPQIPNAPGLDALDTVLSIIGSEQDVQEGIDPLATVPRRVVGGVEFVPIRLAAYAHGYTVDWDSANSTVIIGGTGNDTRTFIVSTHEIFNDNGTVFVPTAHAIRIFSELA